jgi:hypothetical protein
MTTMTKVINGKRYLMRDQRPLRELQKFHAAYERKYGKIDFHRWMIERGKVYLEIKSS